MVHPENVSTGRRLDFSQPLERIFEDLLKMINETRTALGLPEYTEYEKWILYQELAYTNQQYHGRLRKDKQTPYFHHLLGTVVNLVNELKLTSLLSLLSGLHHDDIEDLETVQQDSSTLFAPLDITQLSTDTQNYILSLREQIRNIISGVTKVRGNKEGQETDHEASFRRLLEAMRDHGPRVVYVKLADRANNSDTFANLPPKKQVQKARETLALYVPLARICKVPIIEDHLLRGSLNIINKSLVEQYDALIAQKKKQFDDDYRPKIEHLLKGNFPGKKDILEIQYIPQSLAQLTQHLPPERLESLHLKELQIDPLDSLGEIRIILKTRRSIKKLLSFIIANLSITEKSVSHRSQNIQIENRGEAGIYIHLINNVGQRVHIHLNDALSEQKLPQGILANLNEDATTPKELRDSLDYILRQPGNIFDLAKEELLQPPIHIFTADRKREIILPMNATALDFAAKIHPDILVGAQRAFIFREDNVKIPYSLFDPLPDNVAVFIESCLTNKGSREPDPTQVHIDPGWVFFCKTSRAKEVLRQEFMKNKKESVQRGEQFIQRLKAIFGCSLSDLFLSLPVNPSQQRSKKKFLQEIGELKIDPIHLLEQQAKYTSPVWEISILLEDQPGELDRLLDNFSTICNITKLQTQSIPQQGQQKKLQEIIINADFAPFELPEYKRLKPYQILITLLKLHYKGYQIKAKPTIIQDTKNVE